MVCRAHVDELSSKAAPYRTQEADVTFHRRSRAIAFKAIADGLPSDAALQARLVRAPYPMTLMHELQLHAWNDVRADGRQYCVDLMDDAGALYEKVASSRVI